MGGVVQCYRDGENAFWVSEVIWGVKPIGVSKGLTFNQDYFGF